MIESVESRLPGAIAFTHRDFTFYQLARFFIVAALEMQSVAVGWQVYEITRRPLDLGLIGEFALRANRFGQSGRRLVGLNQRADQERRGLSAVTTTCRRSPC